MTLKHRLTNTGFLQTNTVFNENEIPPYFVGAGTVVAGGPGSTVSVPLGVLAGDLLIVFAISGGAMATPAGWTAVATTTPGTLVWYKFAGASETAAPFTTISTTSTVMLAYRNVLGVDVFATSSGQLPRTLTGVTTTTPNAIIIQAVGQASSVGTAAADPATTTRVNFPSTGAYGGFCISDELQSYIGASIPRTATLVSGSVTSYNTVLALITNPSPALYPAPVRFTANNIQGQLNEVAFSQSTSSPSGSLRFDGSTGYLSIPNNDSLNMETSNFTLEAWIYLTATPNNPDTNMGAIILDKDGQDSVSWPQYSLLVNNSRQVCVSLSSVPRVQSTPTTFITGSTTLALNTWHHVAFTRVGTSGTLYVNGLSAGSTSSVPSTLNGATRSLLIGYETRGTFNTSYLFPGNMSNIRILKGTALYTANFAPPTIALSSVANTVLLLNTTLTQPFVDSSGNNNIITVNGGVTSNTLAPVAGVPANLKLQLANTGIIYVAGQFDEYNLSIFVPSATPSISYLVVAGGGGGADRHGGGGGAGGYLANDVIITTGVDYTITVGAGGLAGSYPEGGNPSVGNPAGAGSQGANSSIIGGAVSIVSIGGGGGGTVGGNPTGTFGSGGGGGGIGYSGLSGTVGQGTSGGNGSNPGGGGGGGANTAGGNADPGSGGAGKQWLDENYYAGGGGGAWGTDIGPATPGGIGGGGAGAWDDATIEPGATNTGGGGGGSRSFNTATVGRPGGSGIVIVRYPDTYTDAVSTTGSPDFTNSGGFKTYTFTGSGTIRF